MDISKLTDADVLTLWERIKAVTGKEEAPEWAKKELKEAMKLGITDGENPMRPTTRLEAAIMSKRAAMKATEDAYR